MLTKETPETFYIGKFWVCFLVGGGELGVGRMHLLYTFKPSHKAGLYCTQGALKIIELWARSQN